MIRLRSRRLTATLSLLLAAAALTCAPAALADIAAPEYCPPNDSVGQSCSTAGPDFDEEGTCQVVSCDGGNGPCGLLCELAPDGGTDGGTEDAGGPVLPPPDDAGPPTLPPSDDGGSSHADAGTVTTLPPPNDAGIVSADAGGPGNGGTTNGATKSSLASSSSCSTMGPGIGSQAGSGFFALGALGILVSAASRRRRKA